MNEDYILDLLVYSALNRGSNLTHHGIPHQKWGERNGPPYPLSRSQKSAAEKKAEDQANGHAKTELKVPSRTSNRNPSSSDFGVYKKDDADMDEDDDADFISKVYKKACADTYYDYQGTAAGYDWLKELEIDIPEGQWTYCLNVREYCYDKMDDISRFIGGFEDPATTIANPAEARKRGDKFIAKVGSDEQKNNYTDAAATKSEVYKYFKENGEVPPYKEYNDAVQKVNKLIKSTGMANAEALSVSWPYSDQRILYDIKNGLVNPNDSLYGGRTGYGIKGQRWSSPADRKKRDKEPKQPKELYNPETGKVNKLEYMKRVLSSDSFDKNLDTYNQLQEAKTIRKQKKEAAKSEKQTRKRDLAIKSMSNRGLTQEEIAKRLGISPSTVSNVLS